MRASPWLVGFVTIATVLAGWPDAEGRPPGERGDEARPAAPTMTVTSVETCGECHDVELATVQDGPHGVIDDPAWLGRFPATSSCGACHGDGTAHLDSGGEAGTIFAFGDTDLPVVKSDQCLTCHASSHPRFFLGRHAAVGLDCTTCHSIHDNAADGGTVLKIAHDDPFAVSGDPTSATCESCHADIFARFGFNERHRLQEGVLGCTTCHDPHAPSSRLALGGFKAEACTTCHADKAGPFVFEHGSQRVEGCVACHDPHGAPTRHMLNTQSVASLCYSCHAGVPGFHTRFTNETVCTNCHSTIHGSNFDPAFLQ